uniref:C2 domain-containing protein n=1 Tax=Mola mola TaxID=94237 RepID=A0A3Q3W7U1_MOLML
MCCFHSTASCEAMASTLPLVLLVLYGYVKVFCGTTSLGQTSIRHNEINPWWNEEFAYYSAQENDILRLEVYDSDTFFDDRLGVCERRLTLGTYDNYCTLEKGGSLHYIYTLS